MIRTGYDAFLVACALSALTAWGTARAFPPSWMAKEPPVRIVTVRVVNKDQSRIAQAESLRNVWRERHYHLPWGIQ